MDKNFVTGVLLTLLGAVLWGISGTCSQFVQHQRGINAEWLVTFRLLTAGTITVAAAYAQGRGTIFRIFRNRLDTMKIIIFGLFGIGLCQYAYFKSIFYAGAGIATVLQYIAPVMIILYVALVHHKMPSRGEAISVVLASAGTVLIALHGDFSGAAVNMTVLFWGLLSAVAVAIYSVQPVSILRKYGTGPVVGFGMLIGGISGELIWTPRDTTGIWDMWTFLAMASIVILGTVVSFNAYLEGVRRIGAVRGSILASVEPISAALFAWALLGNTFTGTDIIGFALILATVFILAGEKENKEAGSDN